MYDNQKTDNLIKCQLLAIFCEIAIYSVKLVSVLV